jgi:multiple sugar transport system substrate-binding protein
MIGEKLVDAWTGSKSVEDVCATITEEMNATLAEEQ